VERILTKPLDLGKNTDRIPASWVGSKLTTPSDPGVARILTTPLDPGVERRVKSAEQFLFKFRNNFYILSVFTMEAISILLQIKV
jgi:hypothetical protein